MYTSACTPHVIQWNQLMGRVDSRMCVKQKVGTHWGIWTGALEWSWLCNRRNNFHMLWSVRDQQMGNVKSTAIGEERRPSNLKMCRRRSWEVKCSFPREHASFHVDCIHLVFHFPVERETRSKVNLSQTGFPNFGIQSRPEHVIRTSLCLKYNPNLSKKVHNNPSGAQGFLCFGMAIISHRRKRFL